MFESAELGHKLDKKEYDKIVPELRADLLDVQYDVLEAKRFPVIILISGIEGAGKGETVNLLNEWMDPRHIENHAFPAPTDEERARPPMWRFWRALPPRGKLGVFFGNWYTDAVVPRVAGVIKQAELDERLAEIKRFEKMLTDEGALLFKFWFHLSKKNQKRRLETLSKDPKTRWRVTDADWRRYKQYDRYAEISEHALRITSQGHAPWLVVDGYDERYRSVTVGNILLDAMRKRVAWKGDTTRRINAAPIVRPIDKVNVLNSLNLTQALTKKKYQSELEAWQGRLNVLARDPRFNRHSLLVLFEGNDAAGKGGAIRRITQALDARQYTIVPIAAPTEEERAQPYLWRFWRHVPGASRFAIFDRSWYGRVLVERVEGYCAEPDWMRAYGEINDFEDQLSVAGTIVVKFWLTISQEEQLRRFKEREQTRFKRFKITEEDWRNREKWPAYEQAICDMVDRTSTEIAPWTLVEANDKNFARIKVLKTICERLEAAYKQDKNSKK
jgi:polyphosphate:AMP phosphotransferase